MKVEIEGDKYKHLFVDIHNTTLEIKDKISEEDYNKLMSYAQTLAQLADDVREQEHKQFVIDKCQKCIFYAYKGAKCNYNSFKTECEDFKV